MHNFTRKKKKPKFYHLCIRLVHDKAENIDFGTTNITIVQFRVYTNKYRPIPI